ncbi:MAG: CBS domain-containing protein [Desulfobacteraceae bacterium]|nr:CBS domain-containing protein [Desulfobacteraceae bacterium]
MFIRNWMRKKPFTVPSEMNASEALKILEEKKLPFVSIVDNGVLRGILTRRDARGAASAVTSTQSVHEMNFFNERLKVKDLMIRKPLTVTVNDTIETALNLGADMGRSFFPVIDGETLVGTICDRDIKDALSQILYADEALSGITLEDDQLTGDFLPEIVNTVTGTGAVVRSLFTLKDPETGKKRLLMRVETRKLNSVLDELREKGYRVVESVEAQV